MRTINDYGTFEESVAKASDHARELAYELRKLVIEVMPEVPWSKILAAVHGRNWQSRLR